ncbi:hypothetical protein [Consotaella aegiceratis]|uniref:hypothetical protein n=1 Tax=Consotaella aegiceratis TaxID=3097961 RepID=UPI002F42FD2E
MTIPKPANNTDSVEPFIHVGVPARDVVERAVRIVTGKDHDAQANVEGRVYPAVRTNHRSPNIRRTA